MALSKLSLEPAQVALFDGGERRGRTIDAIREKFGYDALHLAMTLSSRK